VNSDKAVRREASRVWAHIPLVQRREVLRLAARGQRHPDPAVAEAAERYAATALPAVWWNQVPGWLLPVLGAVLIAAGVVLGVAPGDRGFAWITGVGGAVVVACGLLGQDARRDVERISA
jgi:hypothetical protein